ncbi:MAG: peptidoglycan editing factor PgeF [Alphaproteobacteria bacterium]
MTDTEAETGPEAPPALAAPGLAALERIRHGFFTRAGGVSDGLYDSLNCGFGSRDRRDSVAANRARVAAAVGGEPTSLVTGYQTHSVAVAHVEAPWEPGAAPQVDGLVTDRPGIVLGVLTADCAPILFADARAGVIATAHAGWRGALAGVIEETVKAMVELGARRRDIAAAIGPCIAFESYEVGPEFPAPFIAESPDNERFFRPAERAGHFMFDLSRYAADRLVRLDLGTVDRLARDTCAEEAMFFSYRRSCLKGEADFGRGLSAIALDD